MTDAVKRDARDVVAIVTPVGRLACVPCVRRLDLEGRPVYIDAMPHNTEACDFCDTPNVSLWLAKAEGGSE